jgi:hypothetical protein
MIVRVTVVDADQAGILIDRVRDEVDVEEVEFDPARHQVRIDVERNPDETLTSVLNLLENWLGAAGHPPTSVEIDERRYVLGAVG